MSPAPDTQMASTGIRMSRRTAAVLALLVSSCSNSDYRVQEDPADVGEYAPVISVSPAVLDFGEVLHGETASLPVTITNRGNAALEVSSLLVTGSESFSWSGPGLPLLLQPEESGTVDVTYAPHTEEEVAKLEVESSDSVTPEVQVDLLAAGLFPILDIRPDPYDFGEVPLGCTYSARMTLKNVGGAPLEITDVAHAGVGFELAEAPALPMTLEPGRRTYVTVVFTPPDLGSWDGSLWVTTNDVSGTGIAYQHATAASWTTFRDEYWQPDGPWDATDILFYIDQSGSMVDDQENLRNNFTQFTATLEDFLDDYQVMAVTEDSGCHNEIIINQDTRNADDIFAAAVQGSGGVYTEAGLTIAWNALRKATEGECNEGFLRDDAKTMLILVSDEPEQSMESWADSVEDILALAPNASISAIAGDWPDGCATAEAGAGYYEASLATGGAFLSICATDWGEKLRTLAQLTGGTTTDTFPLTYPPVEGTLTVTVNDEPATGWTWVSEENAVVFGADAIPVPGAHVVLDYGLACADI